MTSDVMVVKHLPPAVRDYVAINVAVNSGATILTIGEQGNGKKKKGMVIISLHTHTHHYY